jgi:LysR family glycine cleavage system transcriptional activator
MLSLTPSAISHQIRELEEQLRVPLFVRKTRALALTPAGRALLAEVEPLLIAVEDAVSRVSSTGDRRTVSVALPPFFASELFIPRLSSLQSARPDLDVQLDTRDPMPREHVATSDISVLITAARVRGHQMHRLFPRQLVAACSSSVLTRITALGRGAFTKLPIITHRLLPLVSQQWAQESGFDPPAAHNIIEFDNMFAVARAAETGLGVALIPSIISESWFASGALVRASDVVVTTGESYYLACRDADSERLEVAAMLSWAINEFHRAS